MEAAEERADGARPENGWTGGQYSLYRVVLASALLLLVWTPMPTDGQLLPWSGQLELHDRHRVPLTLIAICIALGVFDRWFAAIALLAAFCVGHGYSWFVIQFLLLAHLSAAPVPYGSVLAIGRPDPGAGWRRSHWNLALASWPLFLAPTSLVAVMMHDALSPSGASVVIVAISFFGVFAVSTSAVLQRSAWLLWFAAALFVLWRLLYDPHGEVTWSVAAIGVTLVSALASFDPKLIRPRRKNDEREVVYYDGDCGLCHRTVRFLLAEDVDAHFRFAALQGAHFAGHVSVEERAALADSVIVRTTDSRLLQRSSAIVHLLLALGGLWRVIGSLLWCVPRPLRDLVYDGVARVRKRVFPAPDGLCPLIPPDLGARFLA